MAYKDPNDARLGEARKRYRAAHREEVLKKERARYWTSPERARARVAKWRQENPEKQREVSRRSYYKYHEENKARSRTSMLKIRLRAFGLTPEDYAILRLKQLDRCAICGCEQRHKLLAVDHDHNTGRVGGLLCNRCNVAVGAFGDDAALLRKASAYLEAREGDTWLSQT